MSTVKRKDSYCDDHRFWVREPHTKITPEESRSHKPSPGRFQEVDPTKGHKTRVRMLNGSTDPGHQTITREEYRRKYAAEGVHPEGEVGVGPDRVVVATAVVNGD